MRTAAEYIESLRQRRLELWIDGEKTDNPVDHPKIRPAVNAVAATYALAHHPKYQTLASAHSTLIDGPINRFTHLFTSPEDLLKKVQIQRILGTFTGTCFQRCVGMDGINALFIATYDASPEANARFTEWLRGVQTRDEMLNGAMTDAKGDRSKRPSEQPDHYLRIVDRQADGIVIRGTKLHQTGAANSHQILVMPGQGLRPGEEQFAVACAMPVDNPGVRMVLGKQPSDERKGTADAGNARFGGQECVVIFDDVFVPYERVFLDGNIEACSTLVDAFAGFHRASYGGCKPGNLDVLIGATALLTKQHGVRRASHVRDKLVEMVHLTESLHGLGIAASTQSTQHASGIWQVDRVLANVCKHTVTRVPFEVVRLAEDLAGGSMSTLPSLADWDHPKLAKDLEVVFGSRERGHILRLIEAMAYGSNSVPLRIECMHGAGSPQAQRIVLERETDWEAKMQRAEVLAGLTEDQDLSEV